MKKTVILITIGLVLVLSSAVEAIDTYTETLISNELIRGGTPRGWHGDDQSWLYALPFPFPFYGTDYNSVYICSNGFLNFGYSRTDYSNSTNGLKSTIRIAPLWDDLRTDASGSDIFIHQPTTDSVCIRWYATQYSGGRWVEFEVVLYRNGNIKFNYGTTSNTLTPTVGISKGDNVIYLLSTYNDRSSLNNAQTSLIRPQVPNQPPTANPSANPTSGVAPLTVNFTGGGSDPDGTIVGYSWNFGDGGTSTQQNTSHTYNTAGTYTARLTVTDNGGATGSATVTITVTTAPPPPPAEIPKIIRFQGKIGDADEVPLDGAFTLTFRLYDAETGGTPIWKEVQGNVNIEDGLLDVELGSVTQLNLAFDKQYWLGVEVGSDGEMFPRFKLTTVPYSFRSKY